MGSAAKQHHNGCTVLLAQTKPALQNALLIRGRPMPLKDYIKEEDKIVILFKVQMPIKLATECYFNTRDRITSFTTYLKREPVWCSG